MKISVSSYSFSQLTRAGLHTQFSLVSLAKSLGFDGIEFTDLVPPEGMTELDYAGLLRDEAKRCGIAIVCYSVSADLLAPEPKKEIERLCRKVDTAVALGSPLMRHDAYFRFPADAPADASFDGYLDCVAERFRAVTEYAEKRGIRTCTENHGTICQDPERLEALVARVAHPNFGWLVDIGNFLCADCDPLRSVRIGAPHAFHVHAKDFSRADTAEHCFVTRGGNRIKGVALGHGIVPVEECLKTVYATGYDGYVTVEYEGEEPALDALTENVRFLRSFGL